MVKLSVLFAVKTFPTENDDYYDEANPNISGLAEWFLTVPDLFLLLLGNDAHATPFAAYSDAGVNKALVVETQKAQQRWQAFYQLALQIKPALQTQLATIQNVLMAEKLPFLALDIWSSVTEKEQAKKTYNAYVESLIQRAKILDDALSISAPSQVAAPISALLVNSHNQLGYWSVAAITREFELEREDIANIAFLADYQEYEDENPYWLYHIPAYIVRKKDSPQRSPIGVVTPYGRWLVPLALGMTSVDDVWNEQQASLDGWIKCDAVEYDKKHDCTRHDSVLFDVNGNQVTPVMQNTALLVHSAKVGSLYKDFIDKSDKADIVHLPDLSLILASISGVDYSEDGYIRYRKKIFMRHGEPGESELIGLMQADGQVLVLADTYSSIGEFHKTKHLAVVTKDKPDFVYDENKSSIKNIGHLVGVINKTGQLVVPCEYLYVLPITGDNRLKVHQKDRLLLVGTDEKLSIYKTNGELVAATNYQVPGQLIYLDGYLNEGTVTVTDGENVMQMDFDGIAGAPEMRLSDFMDAVLAPYRNALARVKQNRENLLQYKTVSAQTIIDAKPWDALFTLCNCVCLADENTAVQMCKAIAEHLQSGDYDDEDWSIPAEQPAASVAFNIAFRDASESGFGARIDWKDSETLGALASMAPKITALKGFKWSANDNGDNMTDGIAAAAKYVQKSKVNLFTLPADGDLYEIGFVADANMQSLIELTNSVGIHLNFDWA
jgi:WG containing repeat